MLRIESIASSLVAQVTEFHSTVQLKLEADLKQPHPSHLNEVFKGSQMSFPFLNLLQFQEACCLAAVDRVAVFANPESLAEVGWFLFKKFAEAGV